MWWTFSILVWATAQPTMHQNFDTVILPVPYTTEQQCKDGIAWINVNMPRVTPPSPNTRQVYVCAFIPSFLAAPALPDTQVPSIPLGLVGIAASPTQINLTWEPATDNVGVVGYIIYLNDVLIARTPATAYTHTGLIPNTTYKYRVSAYDAVLNNGPWTPVPVTVTTPLQ